MCTRLFHSRSRKELTGKYNRCSRFDEPCPRHRAPIVAGHTATGESAYRSRCRHDEVLGAVSRSSTDHSAGSASRWSAANWADECTVRAGTGDTPFC